MALPKSGAAIVIAKQVLRSGTSVGAHYAESCRSKSKADFVNKLEGATQELEETLYWLDLLVESSLLREQKIKPLQQEASELMAIFVTMIKKAKQSDK